MKEKDATLYKVTSKTPYGDGELFWFDGYFVGRTRKDNMQKEFLAKDEKGLRKAILRELEEGARAAFEAKHDL